MKEFDIEISGMFKARGCYKANTEEETKKQALRELYFIEPEVLTMNFEHSNVEIY